MSGHTPGPWFVREGDVYAGLPDGSIMKIASIDQLRGIAPHWEPSANSFLMAAAPDLLEALRVLLIACTYKEGGSAHRQAFDAIAKATGEAVSP